MIQARGKTFLVDYFKRHGYQAKDLIVKDNIEESLSCLLDEGKRGCELKSSEWEERGKRV